MDDREMDSRLKKLEFLSMEIVKMLSNSEYIPDFVREAELEDEEEDGKSTKRREKE